jgi:hypothetical protein
MSRDEIAVAVMVGSFALLATLHLLTVTRLARTGPWWRGLVALFVPPLAPYWAIKGGHRVLGIAWLIMLAAWAVCRVFLAR